MTAKTLDGGATFLAACLEAVEKPYKEAPHAPLAPLTRLSMAHTTIARPSVRSATTPIAARFEPRTWAVAGVLPSGSTSTKAASSYVAASVACRSAAASAPAAAAAAGTGSGYSSWAVRVPITW